MSRVILYYVLREKLNKLSCYIVLLNGIKSIIEAALKIADENMLFYPLPRYIGIRERAYLT